MSNPTPNFQPQNPHMNQSYQGQQSFGQQSSGSGSESVEIPGKGTRTLASIGQRALARIIELSLPASLVASPLSSSVASSVPSRRRATAPMPDSGWP